MSLDTIVHGAQVGLAVGGATGLVPLTVGFLCRERKKAVLGFLGCATGGVVGGIYPAIAVMVLATAKIVQPERQADERATQWSGLATVADKTWYLAAMCWWFVCTIGTMFSSAAFLTPLVLGEPNSAARDSVGKIVEPLMLFGGMGGGMIIGLAGFGFVSRKFLSSITHSNWAKNLEESTMNRSPLLQKVARYYYSFLLPHDWLMLPKQD